MPVPVWSSLSQSARLMSAIIARLAERTSELSVIPTRVTQKRFTLSVMTQTPACGSRVTVRSA